MKKIYLLAGMILFYSSLFPLKAAASNMTTITVDAADYESGGLMYAIDSDNPSAFSTSNEFVVEAGSSHTVYVKDAAGNISGQVIEAPIEKVGIEVTIGNDSTDTDVGTVETGRVTEPAEAGGGSLHEKTVTDGSSSSEKIFYTITTTDEKVFYMVIDNTRSADNVYLLNQVTTTDLISLAGGANAEPEKKEDSIFTQEKKVDEIIKEEPIKKMDNKSTMPIVILVILLMGGGYYYMKIYKPKKAAEMELQDASDIDDFEVEEGDNEWEEEYSGYDEDSEKEELLRNIIYNEIDDSTEKQEAENILEEE